MPTLTDVISAKDLRRFSKEMKAVIETAVSLGWTGRFVSSGALVLHSPTSEDRVHIPTGKSGDRNTHRTLMRRVLAAASAEQIEHLTEVIDATGATDDDRALGFRTEQTAFGEVTTLITPPEEPSAPTIVSRSPFLARGGSGLRDGVAELYASRAITERKWSDGTVDYECAYEGCSYNHSSARSVAGHHSSHRAGVGALPKEIVAVEVDAEPIYDTAIRRLSNEIETALALLAQRPDDDASLARSLATMMVARRRDRAEPQPHETESLTPEQVLDKVRSLLMAQEITNQRNLAERVEELRAENERLAEQKDRAVQRAHDLRETLETLASLARVDTEEDEDAESASGG